MRGQRYLRRPQTGDPSIYPALMLALNAGMRDTEIRGLRWAQIDLQKAIVRVGESKTEAGDGRSIPLNSDLRVALAAHYQWYLGKFGETRPEWYVFPFGKPQPTDPTRAATSFKTVWSMLKKDAGVAGRWHDNRHRADSPVMPTVSKETRLSSVWRGVSCLADRRKSA
jgi:integrase